jgi:apolipoprotein N-acyltransferase
MPLTSKPNLMKPIFAARLRLLFAPFLLGVLSVAGFAPFDLFVVPVLTLALLFRLWARAPAREALFTGFAFGLGLFGAGVHWVYVSLHEFGGMPLPVALLATALFCMVLALFPAATGWLQARLGGSTAQRHLLTLPGLWLLLEWVRGWLFTGFPWLALGYSQVPDGPLSGYAPVLGVYGVSLMLLLSAGALALLLDGAIRRRGNARAILLPLALLAALWAGGWGLQQVAWTRAEGAPFTVSLLQGNIPQELKWRPEKTAATLDLYRSLALDSRGRLIILPETALPLFVHEVPRTYYERLAAHAAALGGDILIGAPEFDGQRYYNSVLGFGSAPVQVYRKRHLVPFGEFIPLKPFGPWLVRSVLRIPLDDFARGAENQPPMHVAGQRLAIAVCYEDAFGEEMIRQLPEATLLVNVSNDAWFGDSVAPWQHLQMAQTRALEMGRFMLRATNTGVTAIIDPRGNAVALAPQFETTRLDGTAQGYADATPYVRGGNGPVLALAGFLLLAGRWRMRRT